MTIVRRYAVRCDGCGFEPDHHSSSALISRELAAQALGWTSQRVRHGDGYRRRDLCRRCTRARA